jgi:hypothetical protein
MVAASTGIPPDWAILSGSIASNGEPYHICDTCLKPINGPMEKYREAKYELMKAVSAMVQKKIEPRHVIVELLRAAEEDFL